MRKFLKAEFVVLGASIFALGFALVSQYGFGFHPCELCIWQRWAYGAVIVSALLSFRFKWAFKLMILALVALTALAAYHFGIEQKWWEGFQKCTSAFKGGTLEELRAQIMGAPVVRCDEASWFFLKLSMAGWNVLYSAFLIVYAIKSLFNRRRAG